MAGIEQAEEGEEGEGHETQGGKRELPGAKLDLLCIHGSSHQGQFPVCSSLSETGRVDLFCSTSSIVS